jgi:hypothetical protein
MERRRFTVIRGGREAAPSAAVRAIDLDCVPRDRWRRTIELRRGDEIAGVLRREGMTGYRAVAETPSKTWLLDRVGVMLPSITIHCDGAEVGAYDDGNLLLEGGRFCRTFGRWADAGGRVLVRDRGDRLRIEPAGLAFSDYLLLALLGEYLKQVDAEPPEER